MNLSGKLETVIKNYFPAWGAKRSKNRAVSTMHDLARDNAVNFSYDSARTNRNQEGWFKTGGSADADINDDLEAIRARSRDAFQNSGRAKGIITTYANEIVGTGIRIEPQLDEEILGLTPSRARRAEDELKELFRIWCQSSDASGRQSFFGQQYQAIMTFGMNGESIYLPVTVNDPQSPISLKIQSIESDRLCTPHDKISDKNVHAGVLVGKKFGEPKAYHFRNTHPGDNSFRGQGADGFFRVPAKDRDGRKLVFHIYQQERPGQTRGVPMLAPVLTSLYDQERYMEAVRMSALLGACFGLIINSNDGANTTSGLITDSAGRPLESFEPAMVGHTTNSEITQVKPEQPGDNFQVFMNEIDRDISLAVGLSREYGMKDITKANFSALRWALADARRHFSVLQQTLIHNFCQPSYEWFVDESVMSGQIILPRYFQNRRHYLKGRWNPDAHAWIDFESEVKATESALAAGITTLQEVATSRSSMNWRDLVKQSGIEKKAKKEAGLIDEPVEKPATKIVDEPKQQKNEEAN